MRARAGWVVFVLATGATANGCGGSSQGDSNAHASSASGSEQSVPSRASGEANGEATTTLDSNGLPQRTANDRTVLTRERCVLASNCDAELARLENATSPQDLHRRADLRAQLCDAGQVSQCAQAAIDAIHDRTVPINTAIARRRAEQACRATQALMDCMTYAGIGNMAAEERRARGLPPDPADGAGDTTIGVATNGTTASGSPGGARVVSVTPSSPPPVGSERPFSESSLSPECRTAWSACQNNDSVACARAALCFVTGNGAPLDQVRAANLYRRACDRGVAYSCTELGIMLLQGEGIPQDVPAARAIYVQGCRGGDLRGCSEAGIMFLNGEGGPVDVTAGVRMVDTACTGGHTHACAVLGSFMYNRAQTDEDRTRGALLVREACRRGDAAACTTWHRIEGH